MKGASILGRYLVVERIAAGGYSVVYRADDERLNRPVCVKVFHRLSARDGAYQSAYEHFIQEAFALSRLTHPNTLRIYDFGYLPDESPPGGASRPEKARGDDAAGLPFQISEFMDRGTLSGRVRKRGPITDMAEATRIVAGLGGALAEAHQYGIIHRDIKPQNILFHTVGRSTVAKLADFGIAKSLPVANIWLSRQMEDTAVVAGRPMVMYSERWASPEQMVGDPVEPASDVYSLALTIIFMLTGTAAFTRVEGLSLYDQRRDSDHHVEQAFAGSDVPGSAISVLQRACAFDAADRPGDAEAFADDLCSALERQERREPPVLIAVPNGDDGDGAAKGGRDTARPASPPRRLHVTDRAFPVADRHAIFVPAMTGTVDVACCRGEQRLRVTFVPTHTAFCVHIKGLTCFLSMVDGRPSSAVQFEDQGRCNLISPEHRQVANMAVSMGSPAAGHRLFSIGNETVALAIEECPLAAVLDFGSGNECLIVYRPSSNAVQGPPPGRGRPG